MLTLTSAVILLSASLTTATTVNAIEAHAYRRKHGNGDIKAELEPIPALDTIFVDYDLLIETLQAHMGCVEGINAISENEVVVQTECGPLRYFRQNNTQAFKLELSEITDPDRLIAQLKSFEEEYGRNVQTYTYNHIKENLSGNMKIESEEVLDDDSLLLTIDI